MIGSKVKYLDLEIACTFDYSVPSVGWNLNAITYFHGHWQTVVLLKFPIL
jgi:hypothetical protein